MRKNSAIVGFLLAAVAAPAPGQQGDSVPSGPAGVFEMRLEMREGTSGAEFSLAHYWMNVVGIHVTGALEFNGGFNSLSAGLSVLPLPFLLGEADIGIASNNEQIVDAPRFSPDYVTHLRAGVLIPVGKPGSGFAVTMTGNMTTLVDNSGGTGGFPPPGWVESTGPHRVVETFNSFLLGLRMKW